MLYVLKTGKTGTYYLNDISQVPPEQGVPQASIPFTDPSSPPVGIPITRPLAEIVGAVGRANVKIIEKPKRNRESTYKVSDAAVRKVMGDVAATKDTEAGTPAPAAKPVPETRMVAGDLANLVTAELADYFKRLSYAKGRDATQLKKDLEAVATFFIRIDPAWEEILHDLKEKNDQKEKRFHLGE